MNKFQNVNKENNMLKLNNINFTVLMTIVVSLITFNCFAANEHSQQEHSPQRLILLKFKPHASQVQIDRLQDLFGQIQQQVSGVTEINWHIDKVGNSEKLYSHAITINFDSEQSIKIYEQHPKHLELISVASPLIVNFFEMNY